MNAELRDRLVWWHLKAKKEKDLWTRFLLYYMIFDAYVTDGSGSGSDKAKLKWFLTNSNSLKDSLDGCWKTRLLPEAKALKSLSPVRDMRPGSTDRVILSNENDLGEIIRFIYQIRCNLFHGSKNRMDGRDSNLVEFGGNFLRHAIDWWLVSTR